jgi:hypothetical protein
VSKRSAAMTRLEARDQKRTAGPKLKVAVEEQAA